MKPLLLCILPAGALLAAEPGVIVSRYAASDFSLTADPNARHWKGVAGVFADKGPFGETVPGHGTEIRSRWTPGNIYFLFICPYQ
jgi:hypothetical protein